jgi:hypothetical protein
MPISPDLLQARLRLGGIFMPFARSRADALYPNRDHPARFVHYTSAEAALSIIRSKRFWTRNTMCMSDYREVHYGFELLKAVFDGQNKGAEIRDALETCVPNVAQTAIDAFNLAWRDIPRNTYVGSLSEHDPAEDFHGRLSMWRAFGPQPARVAIVLAVPWFADATEALSLMFSPVAYMTRAHVATELETVARNIRENADFLRDVDRDLVRSYVSGMLVAAVTCMKHAGFHEEREWRVIYGPKRWPSKLMEESTEVVGGVPQLIYKVPLDAEKAPELAPIDLAHILDRVIIGPSLYPIAMYDAFADALNGIGVTDTHARICVSDIPIRG